MFGASLLMAGRTGLRLDGGGSVCGIGWGWGLLRSNRERATVQPANRTVASTRSTPIQAIPAFLDHIFVSLSLKIAERIVRLTFYLT